MMDYFILLNTVLSILIFLPVHIAVFQKMPHQKVVRWIPPIFAIGTFFPTTITLLAFLIKKQIFGANISSNFWLTVPVTTLLFLLFAFIYTLGIFGVMVAAIRIRLLTDIASENKRGISHDQICHNYSKETILKRRLEKLIASQVVICRSGFYKLKSKRSLFILHTLIIRGLRRLYTGN